MELAAPRSFGAHLKALRETAGYTQEELAKIAGLSVHGVSALERGERRRPHLETVRALSAALDLSSATREALLRSARWPADDAAVDELSGVSLPLLPTALIGRDADLATLQAWLAEAATRLLTLTGPGGAGKTRLALEIAHAQAAERATRVVFVPLAAIRTPAFVAPAVAEALGLSDPSALRQPPRARAAFDGLPTLLVLDNFEHVLKAAPLVADLLSWVGTLRVLVTSRAPLHVRGEREYVVGPLALAADADAMAPAELARCPAVFLFAARVREVQPGFELTAANGPTVAAICRRLDALPLALELAAPWMKVLTPEALLHRLGSDAVLSTASRRDLPERQQTMNATVAWSYRLLAPAEQRAFRRFGILPGLFRIDAAAAVLATPSQTAGESGALQAIAGLIDKSLLVRAQPALVPTGPLYLMLETVRAYAALELTAAGERADAMDALVRYCTAEAALAATGLVGPAQVEWLNRVDENLQSYRGVMAWLIEEERHAEAIDIAWGLLFFWLIRGHAAEGLRWYEHTLTGSSLPPAAQSKARLGAAHLLYTQGEQGRSRAELTRALALAHDTGDMTLMALAEHLCGYVDCAVGDVNAARRRFADSVERFAALGIPWGTGQALSGLAATALAAGDAVQAERLLDEAAAVLRHAGPWFLSLGAYLRAFIALRGQDPDRALALVRDSLTRIRALQDTFAFVYSLVALAAAAALRGDDEWVARILGARDAVAGRSGTSVVDSLVYTHPDETERAARARLGPDRWAAAYAAGRESSIDLLLEDIDRAMPRSGSAIGGPRRD